MILTSIIGLIRERGKLPGVFKDGQGVTRSVCLLRYSWVYLLRVGIKANAWVVKNINYCDPQKENNASHH